MIVFLLFKLRYGIYSIVINNFYKNDELKQGYEMFEFSIKKCFYFFTLRLYSKIIEVITWSLIRI